MAVRLGPMAACAVTGRAAVRVDHAVAIAIDRRRADPAPAGPHGCRLDRRSRRTVADHHETRTPVGRTAMTPRNSRRGGRGSRSSSLIARPDPGRPRATGIHGRRPPPRSGASRPTIALPAHPDEAGRPPTKARVALGPATAAARAAQRGRRRPGSSDRRPTRPSRRDRRPDARSGPDRASDRTRTPGPAGPGLNRRPDEPAIPEGVDIRSLHRAVRAELRSLPKELAEIVASHLVVAGQLIDEEPELAYLHAEAARRRAARLPIVREAAAETAYAAGRYDVALSEFRALRRMTGHMTTCR